MTQPDFGRLGLGPVDQVAFVVEDLEVSLPAYEAVYGSFEVSETAIEDAETPGGHLDCVLKLGVNDSGPVEIELIEVLEGRPPHRVHLDEHGEGLHHVRFRVDSLEDKIAALESEGFRSIFYKRFAPTIAFAYVEAPPEMGGSIIELLELVY
jgi:methylmalonyl-CoA/ethylmalonyl-CoA epimerase